jgi:hypothetical protein
LPPMRKPVSSMCLTGAPATRSRTVVMKSCQRAAQVRLIRAMVAAASLTPNRSAINSARRSSSVAEIVQIPGVGNRNNADQILFRMVQSGEITRISRGRYGPLRRRAFPTVPYDVPSITPASDPVAPPIEPHAVDVGYTPETRLDPQTVTPEQWVQIGDRYHHQDGGWISDWPRPGLPGCPMPPAIQALYRKSPPAKPPVAPIPPKPARDNGLEEVALREDDRALFDPSVDRDPPPDVAKPAAPSPAAPSSGANGHRAAEIGERRFAICEEEADAEPVERPSKAEPSSFDFDLFLAMLSCMYGKHGLCPPVRLRHFAAGLVADGVSREFCLAAVERHLGEHAASRSSGSADGLLPYLDGLIRHQWNNRRGAARRRVRHDEFVRDWMERDLGVQPAPRRTAGALDEYTAITGRPGRATTNPKGHHHERQL